jgi:hypothetical protein
MVTPAYGLAGANQAIDKQQFLNYSGYNQPGMQANQLQAALSGTLGPQAQQQAYNNFNASPGQAWLQEQGDRAVTRNAAATGGLQGGNVLQALQRQGMGLAQQDYQNQFNNLGSIADRGMQGMALNSSLGRDKAGFAFQAGQDIGNNFNATTSALAQLANQQGSGLSDMYGNYAGNIANLLSGAGGQQSTSNANLAALLANIGTGSATNLSGLPSIPGTSQRDGVLNNFLTALSGIPPKPTP